MSGNDYVKFVTQELVRYIEKPKEERVMIRKERKSSRPPLLFRMFGMIPVSIKMLMKK